MERRDEITQLTNELQRLTLCTNIIASRLQELHNNFPTIDSNTDTDATQRDRKSPLQVGDRVRITNSYQGRRNTQGTVTKVLNTQAWVQPDDGDKPFRKFKANLARIFNWSCHLTHLLLRAPTTPLLHLHHHLLTPLRVQLVNNLVVGRTIVAARRKNPKLHHHILKALDNTMESLTPIFVAPLPRPKWTYFSM